MQLITISFDHPLIRNFVKPEYCEQLYNAGIKPAPYYEWKLFPKYIQLDSSAFDHDAYYISHQQYIDKINGLTNLLPAFTIKDIEVILPGYTFSRTGVDYELMIEGIDVPPVRDARLPDAFAKMLLQLLSVNVINGEQCTQLIAKNST